MEGAKKKHKLLSRVPSRARCDFGHCSAVSETVYAGTRQGDKNRSKWRAKHKRDTHGVMPSMKRGSHSGPYVFRCSTCGFTKGFAVSSSKRSCKAAHSCPRAAVKVESGGGGDGKPGLALKRKRGGGGGDSEGGEGMQKKAKLEVLFSSRASSILSSLFSQPHIHITFTSTSTFTLRRRCQEH
jgi:hypothetical protein